MKQVRTLAAVFCVAASAFSSGCTEGSLESAQDLDSDLQVAAPPATPATPAKPPAKHCDGAFGYTDVSAAIDGDTIIGSTDGEPNSFEAPCGAEFGSDTAYMITTPKNVVITASTFNPGTGFDTVLSVRALCDGDAVITCNDDAPDANFRSTVSFNAGARQSYLVLVSGYQGATGPFELSITSEPAKPGATPATPATPSDPAIPGGPGGPATPPVACAHSVCTTGEALKYGCSSCSETVCEVDPYCCNNFWDALCVNEAAELCDAGCTPPPPPPNDCGDGVCGFDESCFSCEQDCGACPLPECGDGFCEAGEWCGDCPQDCGECPPPPVCGDSVCVPGEDCFNCAPDCGACGDCSHDTCTVGTPLSPDCSPCAADVCAADAFCCTTSWDAVCVDQAAQICGPGCF